MATDSNPENAQPTTPPKPLGNRPFGLIFAGIFLIIAAWPLMFGGSFREWAGIVSGVFTAAALIVPAVLTPLNRAWARFGLVMHKITNPLLMGVVFYVTVVPTGLILKLLGKDPLRRKLDKTARTYWIKRDTHAITKNSFDNQF